MLLLLGALIFLSSANGSVGFGDFGEGLVAGSTAKVCQSLDDDQHSPARHTEHRHCAACVVDCDALSRSAIAVISSYVVIVLAARFDTALDWPLRTVTAFRPARHASCASRAPPSIG